VLNYEQYNIHANCNIAIFYNKLDLSSWVVKQINVIKKLNTENVEYLFKIADTLGCVEKHDEAYKVYKKLLLLEPQNATYYHYTAIAAYNLGKFSDSIKYWHKLAELDKQNLISDYYISLAERALNKEEMNEENQSLLYIYQLPRQEVSRRLSRAQIFVEGNRETSLKVLSEKKGEESVYFSLCFDRLLVGKLILKKIKKELLVESQNILRKLILRAEIEDEIKIEAVFLLDIIGAPQPYNINFDGDILEITADPLSIDVYATNEEWELIIRKAQGAMKGIYKGSYKKFVEKLWMGLIKYLYPDIPKMNNIDGWAAALEYVYCKLHDIKTSQEAIAAKYEVPIGSIREKYKMILDSIENRADYKEKK
jgi:tetratricopeptide (TPR) repeat protein